MGKSPPPARYPSGVYHAGELWLYTAPKLPDCRGKRPAMASPGNRPKRPVPRLYLITPAVADPAAVQDMLGAAVRSGDVAAVLLQLAAADERTLVKRAKKLGTGGQGHGA